MLSYYLNNNKYHNNYSFFFFNDTATTEIYTLSLHDALPIFFSLEYIDGGSLQRKITKDPPPAREAAQIMLALAEGRSEEHTSELQSLAYLVCRLLLEKKKSNLTSLTHSWYDKYT